MWKAKWKTKHSDLNRVPHRYIINGKATVQEKLEAGRNKAYSGHLSLCLPEQREAKSLTTPRFFAQTKGRAQRSQPIRA